MADKVAEDRFSQLSWIRATLIDPSYTFLAERLSGA